jgi:RecJ-like exonuclease
MTINLKFDKPLTFGDKDQIAAIRKAELQQEWDALPACQECEGDGECSKCQQDCQDCGGLGKEDAAVRKFEANNPGMTGFQIWDFVRK